MFDIQVIPGILEKDWIEIEKKIELVKPFANIIHIDIIDGKFADTSTFLDPLAFTKYTKELFFELHMMVDNPLSFVERFAAAGFKRFIGHIERMPDQEAFVAKVEEVGEVFLAVDSLSSIDKIVVPYEVLDGVLIMTVNAGESHQKFQEDMLQKVTTIRSKTDELFTIEVDGGINNESIISAYQAGARHFVSSGFLFDTDFLKQYRKLQLAIEKGM